MPGGVGLHCHSNSSFLDGASAVGDLVDAAADAGMDALALTDTNGLYGAVRFANAAKERGLKPLYGAELHLLDAGHLVVIARDRQGWTSLCRIISAAQLAGEKTKPRATFALVRENAAGLFALTGCAHGAVPRAVRSGDLDAAREAPARAGTPLEHTSQLQSPCNLVFRLQLEKTKSPNAKAHTSNPRPLLYTIRACSL